MKWTPLLFSADMARAMVEKRKWQTRRLNGLHEINYRPDDWQLMPKTELGLWHMQHIPSGTSKILKCPFGDVGDWVWGRETWAPMCRVADPICQCTEDYEIEENHYFEYRADTGDPYPGQWPEDEARGNPEAPKWRPSIFMPREACRIERELVGLRLERLGAISRADCVAEGLPPTMRNDSEQDIRVRLRELWEAINAKRGYPFDLNPWVWVLEFPH